MSNVRDYNVGKSDYSKHKIQPWDIWLEYGLNPWDADIVKRVLRTKEGEDRKLDYEKIIHVCQERIRQIEAERADAIEDDNEEAEPDYKTVMCPSEKYRPELLYHDGIPFDGEYKVYGVFQSDGSPYAYLGYAGQHIYLDLGASPKRVYSGCEWMPKCSFGLGEHTMHMEDHEVSMEIGSYGVSYKKHDYIITCDGRLFRYFGTKGDKFTYRNMSAERADGTYREVLCDYKLENRAIQFTL